MKLTRWMFFFTTCEKKMAVNTMGRTEKEIVIPEHTEIEYVYTCDICGKDMCDDPLDLSDCPICGREVCDDCSAYVLGDGETIITWDILCGSSHICLDCMKIGIDHLKELFDIDATFSNTVKHIIEKWKEEVLLRESSELPRTGD